MKFFNYIFITILLFSCSYQEEKKEIKNSIQQDLEEFSDYSTSKSISEYSHTEFKATLNDTLNKNINAIYAVTSIIAWDTIKNHIKPTIDFIENKTLLLINESSEDKYALANKDYKVSFEINGDTIKSKSNFKIALPFKIPLDKKDPIKFMDTLVKSFGFDGYNDMTSIAYYKNDQSFALRLIPEDNSHEIILIKDNFKELKTLKDIYNSYQSKKESFKQNRTRENYYLHNIEEEDIVRIPIVDFNISNDYKDIEGSKVSNGITSYVISKMYQRTAFKLDEKGAEVEGEFEIYATEAVVENLEPKKMIFDKPFVIFLKKRNSNVPYFGMYVANEEVLIKNYYTLDVNN